jgi:hypothetical protein
VRQRQARDGVRGGKHAGHRGDAGGREQLSQDGVQGVEIVEVRHGTGNEGLLSGGKPARGSVRGPLAAMAAKWMAIPIGVPQWQSIRSS